MSEKGPSGTVRMLSVDQVARRLGVDPRTVRRLIAQGSIAALDIGTGRRPEYRVPERDLVDRLRVVRGTGRRAGSEDGTAG